MSHKFRQPSPIQRLQSIIARKLRQGSRWREFQSALHQAQQAIAPEVKLEYALQHWNEIAAALAERDRYRVPQLAQCHVLS